MTRTPAPADDADLDLALREAAEQWRLDFEVPPMPLLDSGSQPLQVHALAGRRWTRPVLVAASIVAVGAVAAVVISTARPTDQVAGPSVTAGPSPSAGTSLSTGPATSAQEPAPDPVWPVPGLQTLQILDGTPPPTIKIGGSVLTLSSTAPPVDVVTDSDHPDLLGVTPQSGASPCDGNVTHIYLDRISASTITITEATYHRDVTEPCTANLVLVGPEYGLAPFAITEQELVAAGSGAALEHVDLAAFRAPRYLPPGYELGSSYALGSEWGSNQPPGSRIQRVLTARQQPSTMNITLTWQDPAAGNTAAPQPSRSTEVIHCATRVLRTDLVVTACTNSVEPQRAVSATELHRVVDSIPG